MSLKLSESSRVALCNVLKKNFLGGEDGYCCFRRFGGLTSTVYPSSITKKMSFEDVEERMNLNTFSYVSDAELDRYVKIVYPYFYGETTSQCVRDEPNFLRGKRVSIHSSDYSQLTQDFVLGQRIEAVTPLSITQAGSGDLLYLYISKETLRNWSLNGAKTGNIIKADKWCIISEQFLKMWTAIVYEWHTPTFDKLIPKKSSDKEKDLREKLFSGNRLMTNGWLKTKLALEESGLEMSLERSKDVYWRQRTEELSTKFVDVYAATVLMARYGEVPTHNNVPNNRGPATTSGSISEKRTKWSYPQSFPDILCSKAGVALPKTAKTIVFDIDWD